MKIQIYEHVDQQDVHDSVQAGVDFIGVKPGQTEASPGEVSFAHARSLFASVPRGKGCFCNALTLATEVSAIQELVAAVSPDLLHLSGDIELTPSDKVAEIRKVISPVKIMVAIPVSGLNSVSLALSYEGVADYLLLDTPALEKGVVGATGTLHDLNVSAEIVRKINLPVLLAGGLCSENVQDAIRLVRPWGVDSFTHTNVGHSRRKDSSLVARFVESARSH